MANTSAAAAPLPGAAADAASTGEVMRAAVDANAAVSMGGAGGARLSPRSGLPFGHLFDARQWVRDWEAALRAMWALEEAGHPPEHIVVTTA